MSWASSSGVLSGRRVRLAAACALALAFLAGPDSAAAISTSALDQLTQPKPGEQMMLEADQLVYDYDKNTVAAVGAVKIYYANYTLEADRVTYDQTSGRLLASGSVRILEPGGNVLTADSLDVTDNFRDGFVQSLRVETVERTHFAAETAQRVDGDRMIFNHGVYTACEACREHPERPPLWQVKAARIIVDHKEEMVYFQDASLEFLGMPVAWLPVFWTPEPSVKRKSGFLAPEFSYSDPLGYQASVPYFWAVAPDWDVTLSPRLLTNQGFLMDLDYRRRLDNGIFTVEAAGIRQNDPEAFLDGDSGTFAQHDLRGGIRTTGEFDLNQYWSYGWDATLSSDRTFTRNYSVLNSDTSQTISQAHLTGLGERSYLDARLYQFQVLTDSTDPMYDQDRQALVHPVIDYDYVFHDPVLGGQLALTANTTSLSRNESDPFSPGHYTGVAGTFSRTTTELDWDRTFVGPMGQLFTPFGYLRGDAYFVNSDDAAAGLTSNDLTARGMAAAGFEWSWPILAATQWSSQVFEPVAQVILRPNEQDAGSLPNEDAQSLVFDDTNLFQHDKFSGFDRMEGGSRLNVGLRYYGNLENGTRIDGVFGQSIQIGGQNSFAVEDVAGTTNDSGLETTKSDFVSRLSVETNSGHRITARGRFDDADFAVNRAEIEAAGPVGPITATTSLVYLRDLPTALGPEKGFVVRAGASANLSDNWRMFGALAYDVQNTSVIGDSIGFAYDDECLTVSLAYVRTNEAYTDLANSQRVWLSVQLRTLGDAVVSTDVGSLPN